MLLTFWHHNNLIWFFKWPITQSVVRVKKHLVKWADWLPAPGGILAHGQTGSHPFCTCIFRHAFFQLGRGQVQQLENQKSFLTFPPTVQYSLPSDTCLVVLWVGEVYCLCVLYMVVFAVSFMHTTCQKCQSHPHHGLLCSALSLLLQQRSLAFKKAHVCPCQTSHYVSIHKSWQDSSHADWNVVVQCAVFHSSRATEPPSEHK